VTASVFTAANIERWRGDPAAFIEELLLDPETGEPFMLDARQRSFVGRAFALTDDGAFDTRSSCTAPLRSPAKRHSRQCWSFTSF
jgi:hypothetical protein